MLDAQTVDISIVCDIFQGKVVAEVGTIDANQSGKLRKGNVVLQIELPALGLGSSAAMKSHRL